MGIFGNVNHVTINSTNVLFKRKNKHNFFYSAAIFWILYMNEYLDEWVAEEGNEGKNN